MSYQPTPRPDSFPFIGQAYSTRSLNVEAQECINLFIETDPGGRAALFGTPGLSLFAALGAGPVRGLHKIATGDVIAVSGAQVYRITSGAVATLLGTIGTTSGPVSIADNGIQCVIVDGSASVCDGNRAPVHSPCGGLLFSQ